MNNKVADRLPMTVSQHYWSKLIAFTFTTALLVGCSAVPTLKTNDKPIGEVNQEDVATNSTEGEDSLGCDGSCDTLFKKLKKYARNGSPLAQTMLAVSYRTGESEVPKDSLKAWKWIRRAARQRHAPALHIKSMWHREGFAEAADIERADHYLERAADKDYAPAILDLAILNFQRHQDSEGLRLLTKVADMGYPKATKLMSQLKQPAPAIPENDSSQGNGKLSAKMQGQNGQQKPSGDNTEGEVITIVADEVDPVELFAEMIDVIRQMKIYNHRGTTGTRVGDRKCGQPGSGCRVEAPPNIW